MTPRNLPLMLLVSPFSYYIIEMQTTSDVDVRDVRDVTNMRGLEGTDYSDHVMFANFLIQSASLGPSQPLNRLI